MIMSNRQFIYECNEETLQRLYKLTGGQNIYRKEFQQIITQLIYKSTGRKNNTL